MSAPACTLHCHNGKVNAVDYALDDALAAVGPRLRALRNTRGFTLAALSSATGISQSTLSRLETGGRRPNIELLLPLAHVYEVPLDYLVGAPQTGDPRVHLRPVRRFGVTFIPLTRRAGGVQAYKMLIPGRRHSGGPRTPPEPRSHEGYEWLYVLNGRLRLLLGEQNLVLEPGEVVEFDTRLPHALGAADAVPVELLILFGRQGERAHVRARPR